MARYSISPFAIVIVFFVLVSGETQELFVGDDLWGIVGFDYQWWADNRPFQAGDVLIFDYDASEHDVIVATSKDAFDSCTSEPNYGAFTGGYNKILLPEAGTYYFFCYEHCYTPEPMKFSVNVT